MARPLLLLLCVAGFLAVSSRTAVADTIEVLRWQKRIVLIFAADRSALETQAALFREDEAGLPERDLLVLAVTGDDMSAIYGRPPAAEDAASLRRRYDVSPDGFTALLIGKDGGVKWRTNAPMTTDALFARIDAMPMRQSGG